jgi:hypothetical protein
MHSKILFKYFVVYTSITLFLIIFSKTINKSQNYLSEKNYCILFKSAEIHILQGYF